MKEEFLFLFIGIILICSGAYVYYTDVIARFPPRGIISITFDDGAISQYNTAFPLMRQYGLRGTVYVLPGLNMSPDGRKQMTFQEMRDLADAGWEIGSHGLNHNPLTNLSLKDVTEEVFLSKQILEQEGFQAQSFAYPFGAVNKNIVEVVRKSYSSGRFMRRGFNKLPNPVAFYLSSFVVKKETLVSDVCADVKYASSHKKWLILTFHNIEEKAERNWDVALDNFKSIIECIQESGADVKTVGEVMAEYG
jgi:peptidoglycan/xylan/chitin deacetylase (PgdA/CDA1 family)